MVKRGLARARAAVATIIVAAKRVVLAAIALAVTKPLRERHVAFDAPGWVALAARWVGPVIRTQVGIA